MTQNSMFFLFKKKKSSAKVVSSKCLSPDCLQNVSKDKHFFLWNPTKWKQTKGNCTTKSMTVLLIY